MQSQDLIPSLFRTEYSKIVAVLSSYFGLDQMEMAEDIASETFLQATENWPYKGIPENPAAWLYTVAKNKAKNQLHRNHLFQEKISPELKHSEVNAASFEIDLSPKNISDSQLQMLFAISHPILSEKAQISLALQILCGFSIDEIADGLLSTKEAVSKNLQRAREKLRSERVKLVFPDAIDLPGRLNVVLRTLYLLFNEGYYSESHKDLIRKDLCIEAMNLAYLLLKNKSTNTQDTNALMSLMCFQASRLDARLSANGELILYPDRNEELWDTALIEKGFYYLQQASQWKTASKYYLEASIAYWHTIKNDTPEKWESIVKLYDLLLQIEDNEIAAMNRIFALSKAKGKTVALAELQSKSFKKNLFYYLLLSDLLLEKDKKAEALEKAMDYAKNDKERQFLEVKMNALTTS